MHYEERLPHPLLAPFIECYWSVVGRSSSFRPVYPDGCTDIIFNFGSDILIRQNGTTHTNREQSFVVGSMLMPVLTAATGTSDLLGVRFHPGAMCAFTPVPVSELNDSRAALADVMERTPHMDRLRAVAIDGRVAMLDQFFLQQLPHIKPEPWQQALMRIIRSDGQLSLHELHQEVGITERQMERKFSLHVGPGPKQLAQILRFRKLKASLDAGSSKSLLALAFDFGFTDHAHLTKFFKRYAGVAPSEYLARS